MIFLYILLGIIAFLLLVIVGILFLPVTVDFKFKEDFFVKIKFLFIKVYELKEDKPDKAHKQKKADKTDKKDQKYENAAVSLFKDLKKKYGFVGAVKKLFGFFKICLDDIKNLLRHIRFKNICLNLIYGSDDAADTAIKYGEICSAVYPVLSFIDTAGNVEFKKINVSSDFGSATAEFDISLKLKTRIFFLLISAFKLYTKYKNFLGEEDIQ